MYLKKNCVSSSGPGVGLSFLCMVLVACLTLNGCVTGYRRYPRAQMSKPVPSKTMGHYYYHVQGTSLFGGYSALRDFLKLKSPFETAEMSEATPSQGIFVRAKIELLPPSIPALVFGYISVGTLMLAPAWSTKDGFIVVFDVYRDGEKMKSFDYEARRTIFGWAVLLPFIWVNLFTATEQQVFEAIGKQFFEDATPLFIQGENK